MSGTKRRVVFLQQGAQWFHRRRRIAAQLVLKNVNERAQVAGIQRVVNRDKWNGGKQRKQ